MKHRIVMYMNGNLILTRIHKKINENFYQRNSLKLNR